MEVVNNIKSEDKKWRFSKLQSDCFIFALSLSMVSAHTILFDQLFSQRMEHRCPSYHFIGVAIPKVGVSLLAGSAGEPYTLGPESLTVYFAHTGFHTGDFAVDAATSNVLSYKRTRGIISQHHTIDIHLFILKHTHTV